MSGTQPDRAASFEVPDDFDAINRLYRERRWGDGLPVVPPTAVRGERGMTWTRKRIRPPPRSAAPAEIPNRPTTARPSPAGSPGDHKA